MGITSLAVVLSHAAKSWFVDLSHRFHWLSSCYYQHVRTFFVFASVKI